MKHFMGNIYTLFLFATLSLPTWAAVTVKFPEKELAQESVLPLFDNTEAVKGRLVPIAGRLELGADIGFAMNEPFFKTERFGGHLGYNFDEIHGVTLIGQFYSNGLNQNGEAIYRPDERIFVRMDNAPQNRYNFFLNYQVTPFYGKISITKSFVMNLSLYGYAGIGAVGIGKENTENSLAGNIGFGQKFYMTKNFGIRTDLGFVIYNAPNYVQANTPLLDDPAISTDDNPSEISASEFEKITNFDLQLSLSVFLLL